MVNIKLCGSPQIFIRHLKIVQVTSLHVLTFLLFITYILLLFTYKFTEILEISLIIFRVRLAKQDVSYITLAFVYQPAPPLATLAFVYQSPAVVTHSICFLQMVTKTILLC